MDEQDVTSKKCRKCGIEQSLDSFHKTKGKFGRCAQCKECRRISAEEYRSRPGHKEQQADRYRRSVEEKIRRRDESGWVPPGPRTHKTCGTCSQAKSLDAFHKDKKGACGVSATCKDCAIEKARLWYASNRDKAYESSKSWKLENMHLVRSYSASSWRRRKSEPAFRLAANMRSAVYKSLYLGKSSGCFRFLPYTVTELVRHIEKQFLPGMSWENRSKWHIDHIIPLSSFNITNADCEDFIRAWALSNLRPLWAKDNLSKRAKRLHLI